MSLDRLPEIDNGEIKLEINAEGQEKLLQDFDDKVSEIRGILRTMANNSKRIRALKVKFTEQATSSLQEKGSFQIKKKYRMNSVPSLTRIQWLISN